MPTFQPPFQNTLPAVAADTRGVALRAHSTLRLGQPRAEGVTLYKLDGQWREALVPLESDLRAAEVVFMGGRIYPISDAIAAELEGDGWTVRESGPWPSDTRFPSERDYPDDD